MLTININKKPYKLKAWSEISVSEYIAMTEGSEEGITDMKYMSVILGLTPEKIMDSEFPAWNRAMSYIGKHKDFTKYVFDGSVIIDNVVHYPGTLKRHGQKILINQASEKYRGYDLYCFCLAVALKSVQYKYDFERVEKYMNNVLMKQPYNEILGTGYFFFLNYLNILSSGMSVLIRLSLITKTLQKKCRQAYKTLTSSRLYMTPID